MPLTEDAVETKDRQEKAPPLVDQAQLLAGKFGELANLKVLLHLAPLITLRAESPGQVVDHLDAPYRLGNQAHVGHTTPDRVRTRIS
jgi:hypothetical protein